MRDYIRVLATDAGLSEDTAQDLVLAASEAGANAVLHSGTDRVEVAWRAHPDRVEVEVLDGGIFRSRVRVASVDRPGGFGIPLMTALADEMALEEGTPGRPGTRVRLVKRREQGSSPS
jgi:anti-sigma regulatory factor (Ser/Thr protein kinase)